MRSQLAQRAAAFHELHGSEVGNTGVAFKGCFPARPASFVPTTDRRNSANCTPGAAGTCPPKPSRYRHIARGVQDRDGFLQRHSVLH